MRNLIIAASALTVIGTAVPASAQYRDQQRNREMREANREYRQDVREARKDRRQAIRDWRQYRGIDYNRPDPYYGNYYAERYYRSGSNYKPYTLGRNDRIYRGGNGRYYCRRNDGTTGLVIGAVGGAALGTVIAKGDSNLLGAIIGGGAGALLGRELDRGRVRCN